MNKIEKIFDDLHRELITERQAKHSVLAYSKPLLDALKDIEVECNPYDSNQEEIWRIAYNAIKDEL